MKSAVKWGVMGLIALAVVGALLGGSSPVRKASTAL